MYCLEELKKLKNIKENSLQLSERQTDTSIKYIDDSNCCFLKGNLTALIGSKNIHKSIYATNLAYNALLRNKKVVYISTNATTKEIYQRLIVRNSWKCYEKGFLTSSLWNDEEQDEEFLKKYETSYKNFYDNYSNNLYVTDIKEAKIISVEFLENTFADALKDLAEIDLIIIDDIDNIILKVNSKLEISEEKILNKLIQPLVSNAKSLLGKELRTNIVFVKSISNTLHEKALGNMGHLKIDDIEKIVRILADEIIFIQDDKQLDTSKQVKIQLLKSMHNEMFSKAELANSYLEACCIGNNIEYFNNADNPIVAIRKVWESLENEFKEQNNKRKNDQKTTIEEDRHFDWY